jgi:2-iminoacetate synthase
MEVYPLETEDYGRLLQAGLDGVTLYQETYDPRRYDELHPYGPKKDYQYRLNAPFRLLSAGTPFLTLGILLGLSDPSEDLACLFRQYRTLSHQFPAADIALSFPRLRPVEGDANRYEPMPDPMLLKIIALTRLTFPRAAIVLSTRESRSFRHRALEIGVTRMSAASRTGVGGHAGSSASEDQFTVQDDRSLDEIKADLSENGFEPVCRNWHNLR